MEVLEEVKKKRAMAEKQKSADGKAGQAAGQRPELMKRFWKEVSVKEVDGMFC